MDKTRWTGSVSAWKQSKNYGFLISSEGLDLFFHGSSLPIDYKDNETPDIPIGTNVSFETKRTRRGLEAINLMFIEVADFEED